MQAVCFRSIFEKHNLTLLHTRLILQRNSVLLQYCYSKKKTALLQYCGRVKLSLIRDKSARKNSTVTEINQQCNSTENCKNSTKKAEEYVFALSHMFFHDKA